MECMKISFVWAKPVFRPTDCCTNELFPNNRNVWSLPCYNTLDAVTWKMLALPSFDAVFVTSELVKGLCSHSFGLEVINCVQKS
jgi:hypothetical protein